MRKIIKIQETEMLLKRYYEGITTGDEEKTLYDFLSQKNLPEQYYADRAILNYFASQKKKGKIRIIPLVKWTSIAASIITGILITSFFLTGKTDSYAYIDGKKVTSMERIKMEALASIQSWSNSDNDTNSNTEEIINQQLQLFME